MFQPIIDNFLKWEITQIHFVQKVFEPIESYLELVSTITTARFMQIYFIPLLLIFSIKQYVNVSIVAIISHISIIILKWILAGTRPYWWINETDLFTNSTRPTIRQTYLTCETTAGNPSGHVMFSAALLFCVIKSIFYQSTWLRCNSSKLFKYFIWNIYAFVLGLISVSRMYFACHFFHQCITGIGFGIIISQFIQHRKINHIIMEMHRKKAFLIGLGILLLCISIYYAHFLLSQDPYWTVKKAFNWCSDPYHIKPETTSMYSLCREFGLLFGLIFCSPQSKRFNIQLDIKWSLPTVILITCLNKYIIGQIPRWNGALIFFTATFVANMLCVQLLLHIVPRIARKPKIKR